MYGLVSQHVIHGSAEPARHPHQSRRCACAQRCLIVLNIIYQSYSSLLLRLLHWLLLPIYYAVDSFTRQLQSYHHSDGRAAALRLQQCSVFLLRGLHLPCGFDYFLRTTWFMLFSFGTYGKWRLLVFPMDTACLPCSVYLFPTSRAHLRWAGLCPWSPLPRFTYHVSPLVLVYCFLDLL